MEKNFESKPEGSGKTAPTNQPKAGLSLVGQQILVGLLLTKQQLAKRWNCCTHTIARRKDLKPLRLGRRLIRYRLSDIEAIEAAASLRHRPKTFSAIRIGN
jgi:hypothetical protein